MEENLKEQSDEVKNRLACFSNKEKTVVTTSEDVFKNHSSWNLSNDKNTPVNQYTKEEIEDLLINGTSEDLKDLSNTFYYTSGFYKRLITNYSTLLYYTPIIIPHLLGKDKKVFDKKNSKTYNDVLSFISDFNFEKTCEHFAYKVLLDGGYYGLVKKEGNICSVQDLPFKYCRQRTRTLEGTDIIQFDIRWFFEISDENLRRNTVKTFPKAVQKAYNSLKNVKPIKEIWVTIPPEQGIHFQLYEEKPFFADVIPQIVNFNDYLLLEKKKDIQTLKSLLTQELPHTADGTLVIEPEEAVSLHKGLAEIAKTNENVDAITSYGKIALQRVQDDDSTVKNNIEKISSVLYMEGGVSKELFSADGNISLGKSIQNDINLMMVLANQFAIWLKNLINSIFATKSINFGIQILPVGGYNSEDYVSQTLNMAQYGYSYLIPSLAMGVSQYDFVDIKNLENNLYDVDSILVPLKSSFTESSNSDTKSQSEGPSKKESEISDRTIQNKESGGGEI